MTVRLYMDPLRFARWTLLLAGLGALGYSGYVYLDAALYQSYENWAFDQQLRGRVPTVKAYVADSAPAPIKKALGQGETATAPELGVSVVPPTVQRSIIGRIEIPRLRVRAMVREGDDDASLRDAIGHLPDTPLPGEKGNVALAGHRDTLFRQLRNIRKNDKISVRTLQGEYQYVVDSLKIVTPDDVQVLDPTKENVLTLVTCYPFDFIGHAPKRYIIRARQITGGTPTKRFVAMGPPPEAAQPPVAETAGDAVNKP